MSRPSFDFFDDALAEADRWIAETANHLGRNGSRCACGALRAVLQTVRDCLPLEESVKLGNHLPAFLRGAYYDGWKPRHKPVLSLTRETFLTQVAARLAGESGLDPEAAAAGVFDALRGLSEGKMAHLTLAWPKVLLEFRLLGNLASDGAAPQARGPASVDLTAGQIKAATERAEMDGAPVDWQPAPDPSRQASECLDLAKAIQETRPWIRQLQDQTGWTDPRQTFLVLRGVLEALRDRIGRDEAIHLGTQLPPALRGFYFEAWSPDVKPSEERTLEEFRSAVAERLAGVFDISPDDAASAVFRLLAGRIAQGEIPDFRAGLPQPIRDGWPEHWVESRSMTVRGKRTRAPIRPMRSRPKGRGRVFASRRKLSRNAGRRLRKAWK